MANNNKTKRIILAFAVAAGLPLLFYFITRVLSKDSIKLPDYYMVDHVDTFEEDGTVYLDSIYKQVPEITLVNQLGDTVSLNGDLKGKIVVVDFFFTTCPTICPRLTGNMLLLQNAFKKNDTTVHLLSMSVDPQHDTVAALRAYADQYQVNHDHWWLLTGDRSKIYTFARNELGLAVTPGGQGVDDFLHTQKVVLLDKERHIRGYYDGTDTAEMKRCADDIILLSLEKKRKKKHHK